MGEMISNRSDGKIKIQSDSNSIMSELLVAHQAIEEALDRLDSMDYESLSAVDQKMHGDVSEELSDLLERLDTLDTHIMNGPESEFEFLYEVHP